jgi:hypothetical protein
MPTSHAATNNPIHAIKQRVFTMTSPFHMQSNTKRRGYVNALEANPSHNCLTDFCHQKKNPAGAQW